MLKELIIQDYACLTKRVNTARFGPFEFVIGLDSQQILVALQRVEDAHERFIASPLSQVANQLEREVVVSSVFGTNTIEGGVLSESETETALQLDPKQVKEIEQRRAINIKAGYDYARQQATQADWVLSTSFILEVHRLICQDLPHADNQPGVIRDTPKDRVTYVGNDAHGGRYKPPQFGKDVALLLDNLVDWHNQLIAAGIPALIRAPLIHLYYELIHPFWDCNGRVGRVVEATLLQSAGYRYAPFAMARYYLANIDAYFTLFNTCRKSADNGNLLPNQLFLDFFLEGMRQTINALHDRVNSLVGMLLFESNIRRALEQKHINARQYTIVSQLLSQGKPSLLEDIRRTPWYTSLYLKLNDKTRQRDLIRLRELALIHLDMEGRVWPGCFEPANIKVLSRS